MELIFVHEIRMTEWVYVMKQAEMQAELAGF